MPGLETLSKHELKQGGAGIGERGKGSSNAERQRRARQKSLPPGGSQRLRRKWLVATPEGVPNSSSAEGAEERRGLTGEGGEVEGRPAPAGRHRGAAAEPKAHPAWPFCPVSSPTAQGRGGYCPSWASGTYCMRGAGVGADIAFLASSLRGPPFP
ncbi:hypothetical protein AAY473_004400 [Plecturocebus cupreus]